MSIVILAGKLFIVGGGVHCKKFRSIPGFTHYMPLVLTPDSATCPGVGVGWGVQGVGITTAIREPKI